MEWSQTLVYVHMNTSIIAGAIWGTIHPLLLKSTVFNVILRNPAMIRLLSIHLATLVAAVIKTTCKSHTPATCRRSTRTWGEEGVCPFRPCDFCLESRRTSWTSGTRLTELIISQEAGCGLGRNVPKFLTLITGPLHSPRASNFRRSRSRSVFVYWC